MEEFQITYQIAASEPNELAAIQARLDALKKERSNLVPPSGIFEDEKRDFLISRRTELGSQINSLTSQFDATESKLLNLWLEACHANLRHANAACYQLEVDAERGKALVAKVIHSFAPKSANLGDIPPNAFAVSEAWKLLEELMTAIRSERNLKDISLFPAQVGRIYNLNLKAVSVLSSIQSGFSKLETIAIELEQFFSKPAAHASAG